MYSDSTPHQRAAAASVEARRQRRRDADARAARQAHYAIPGLSEHPRICVCGDCESRRSGRLLELALEADGERLSRCECGSAEIEDIPDSLVGFRCAGCRTPLA